MTRPHRGRRPRRAEELFPGFRRKVAPDNPPSRSREDVGDRRKSTEEPRPPRGPVLWHPGDVYRCSNPDCLSCIVILAGPESLPGNPGPPTCLCGTTLAKTPLGVEAPGAHAVPEEACAVGEPCATGEERE